MSNFISLMRRRFARTDILLAMLASLLLLAVSYAVRATPEIRTYFSIHSMTHFAVRQLPGVLTPEAAQRALDDYLRLAGSQAFSFYVVMSNAFILFHLAANILIVLPVLHFFDERKNGTTQLAIARVGNWRYLGQEALTCGLSGFLMVLLPSLVFWLLAVILTPETFPLSQEFLPFGDDFFRTLGLPENIVWLYLVLIILNSLIFFFRTLFAFAASLLIERKAILLFFPLAFTYTLFILASVLGIGDYAALSHFDEHIKSLVPIFTSCLLPLLAATGLCLFACKKENILHA